MIRKLEKTAYNIATDLALDVYIHCGRSDFNDEGLESFKSFIYNEQLGFEPTGEIQSANGITFLPMKK